MRKLLCVLISGLLLGLSSSIVLAQTESDQAPLLDMRQGLSIRRDSTFLINFRFRMQNRFGYFDQLDSEPIGGFDARVRRLRLRIDGFLGSPKLAYYIQLSFSRADQDLVDGEIAQVIRDAMVYYFFTDNFYLGFGQSKLPGNRQRVISSGNLQMPDRSVANQFFNLDRDFGVFIYKNIPLGKQWWQLRGVVSSGEGRNALGTDIGLAYSARLEWLPLGQFANLGDYSEGDLAREPHPKLSVGTSYSFNHRTTRSGGQIGRSFDTPIDLQTYIADMMFKYRGWSLLGEYFYRQWELSSGFELPTEDYRRRVPSGHAYNWQLGRMIGKKHELSIRYTAIHPENPDFQPFYQTKALAHSYYLRSHRIKAQTYVGLDDRINPQTQEGLPYIYKNRLLVMFQLELGI